MENYVTIKRNSDESLSTLWKGTQHDIKCSREGMNVRMSPCKLVY